MDSTIIVAIIMAGGTIGAQFMIGQNSKKAAEASQKAAMDLFEYRINALEGKVMKHNNLMERMVACEKSTSSAHHRLDEIRKEKTV